MTPYQMVSEFHKTYGAPIADKPVRIPSNFDLRLSLLLEEAAEYVEATAKEDFIERVDAIADLVYVTYGAALSHGIRENDLYIDRNYETSTNFTQEIIAYSKAAWRTNNVYTRLHNYGGTNPVPSIEDIANRLIKILSAAYNMSEEMDVNLDDVLVEVHRSNMSKLHHETGKPIYREDGKVLKGENFFKPDIAKVIAHSRYDKFYDNQPLEIQEYLTEAAHADRRNSQKVV